jgi:predicted RNase H-related nuclease YkuK (DUF458 family)
MKKIKFYNAQRQIIEDEIQYILDYIADQPGDEEKGLSSPYRIALGCDSKNRKGKTTYSITIVFYNETLHDGGHVVSKTIRMPKYMIAKGFIASQWQDEPYRESEACKINDGDNGFIFNRLFNEAQYLLELGKYIDDRLQGHYYRHHSPNDYDKSQPCRLPELHVDFSATDDELCRRKSVSVYASTVGMLVGEGFKVYCKPYSWASSSAADFFTQIRRHRRKYAEIN